MAGNGVIHEGSSGNSSVSPEESISPVSTNPESKSATLPVSHDSELELQVLTKADTNREGKETPTQQSILENSQSSPKSETQKIEIEADAEAIHEVETKKDGSQPSKKEKKSFGRAEYKVKFFHFLRIFSYSTLGDKVILLVAGLASICAGVTLPLMNVIFANLVAIFGGHYSWWSGETEAMFTHSINENVLFLVYLFLGRFLLDYIAILGFRMISIRISANMRIAYLRALFAQPISVLDYLPPGQTATILTLTTNILQLGISEKLALLIQSLSLVIAALVIAFKYHWQLTLVTSGGLVFISACYGITLPFAVKMFKEVEHADRMSSSVASEAFASIRMIVACGAESKMAKLYSAWVDESERRGLRMSPLVAFQGAPVFFGIHATFALSFWYAIKLYLKWEITSIKTIIIVLMSILLITISIGSIAAPVTAASRAAGSASILFTIIDPIPPDTGGVRGPEVSSQHDIVLENVTFAYPIRPDVKVLDNLSLRFPAGKVTAIVGASGSGKSTIVGLIERWYELDGNWTDKITTLFFRYGTISTGGRQLHEIDLKWWRSQIGLVQQEPFLFNDTIFKNVEYGLIGTEWETECEEKKKELVEQACREAFADEFIARLPEGYNTHVGDAGIKLSGGQRQRLAIARSIIKHPNILILDEATSSIDVRSEKIVQAALDRASQGRTTITIAHRLSTIMKADNIIVLKKGKVVQQGTHAELMSDTEGAYWGLANAQQLTMTAGGIERVGGTNLQKQSLNKLTFDKVSTEEDSATRPEEPDYKQRGFVGSFGSLLWEQSIHWRWYILMFSATIGAGAAFPLQAFLFAKLIMVFGLWGSPLKQQTDWWCLMFTILAIGVGVSYFALGWATNTVSYYITSTYRKEYFENVLSKPVSFYDDNDNSVGGLTGRMASDPAQLQQLLGLNMAFVFISVFNVIGCVTISFYFGWKLTLLTVCSSMPIILVAGFFRIRYETQFEKINYQVFAESSKFASECISATRTVTSLTLETEICNRYEELLKNHVKNAFRKARFSTMIFSMSDSIGLLCMAFVLWYGGRLLADYEYAPFNYLVIYLAVVQGSISAGQWLSFGPNIAQASAAANRIRSMRLGGQEEHESGSLDFSDDPEDEKGLQGVKIELRNASFKYPTRDVAVLSDLSMTIEKGQFAAIVGPSGCGKTSIISLLERFYTIQTGQILLQDKDIKELSVKEYRESISLVAQESSLFDATIRENIMLGVKESEVSEEMLHQACRDADIHDFISSLPEGYKTKVGARGVALSGGQKQRIAIARALIRNPRILLLDEATSNLDSETERSVQAVFEKTRKGRTTVVVAHRLATVQNADIIFVIGDGKVVESGNHESLLREKGLYYQMCQSQVLNR